MDQIFGADVFFVRSITIGVEDSAIVFEELLGDRKRPEFPSGMTFGFRATMSSWLMSKKRERVAAFAGSERFLRSGGLLS